MAGGEFKAVLRLSADSSGMVTGVNAALQQLDRMQKGVAGIRNMAGMGMAFSVGSDLWGALQQQFQHITDAAHQWSPQAMGAQADLSIAQMQTDQQLGDAFGPMVALIDELKAQELRDVVDYLVANKEAIGETMLHLAEFGVAIGHLTAEGIVAMSEGINYLVDLIEHPFDVIGDTAVGVAGGIFGGDSSVTEAVVGIYDWLREKMGGD